MTSSTAQTAVRSEPWLLRFASLPVGGVAMVAVLLAALGAALVTWVGEPRYQVSYYFVTMVPGYAAAAYYGLRGALSSLEALALPAEKARSARCELARLPLGWVVPGLVLIVGLHVTILRLGGRPLFQLAGAPGDVFVVTAGWLHAIWMPFASSLLLRVGWQFLRIGRAIGPVDLLEVTPLAPFVQLALRLTLVAALLAAAAIGFHIDWGALSVAPQLLLILPLTLLFQLAVFLAPLWGVHERMRDARSAELARVNAAIRGERGGLRDSLLAADAASVSIVDLLQYRAQVESFPTWPFGRAAVARLGLYVVIPVFGWVAAALVERAVDLLLPG